ncbi:dTMP kinase (plasmid) [Rossellomorea sp. AcN35-11]|nr:dTMP kinase [Rossellomorea aquimaris]WJV32211.1 dTMP kinase [Rossellomorea sp. AcN35-11]
MKGKMIVLEGGEGGGKTTLIKLLQSYLESQGYDVLVTREPGGVKIAEQIRSVILDVDNTEMDAKTEAILYAGSRNEHLIHVVFPALRQGKIVLCDRFVDSSLVYQGCARGLGIEEVYNLNKFVIGDYMPDLTLYLDVEPEVGLKRISSNEDREVNRLDKESLEFHQRVRSGYLEVLEKFPNRIKMVDANQPMNLVCEEAIKILREQISM